MKLIIFAVSIIFILVAIQLKSFVPIYANFFIWLVFFIIGSGFIATANKGNQKPLEPSTVWQKLVTTIMLVVCVLIMFVILKG